MSGNSHWLIVLGDVEGLRWVIRNRRMAFTAARCGMASRIVQGDDLILYVTRGAFHNPTRDEAQLAGLGVARSRSRRLDPPLELAGRAFSCSLSIKLRLVLPERQGVPMRPLVEKLHMVRNREAWGQYFRSSLIPVGNRDFQLLADSLRAGANVEAASPS